MTSRRSSRLAGYAAIAGGALWWFCVMMIACGWCVVTGNAKRLAAL